MTSWPPGGFLRAVGDGRIEQVEHQPGPLEPDGGGRSAQRGDQAVLADLLRRSARGDEAAFAAAVRRDVGAGLRARRPRRAAIPPRPRRSPRRPTSRSGGPPPASTPGRAARSSWLMTIAHRKAVDRVRSAEAASRRDSAYHDANQTVDARLDGRRRRDIARGASRARGSLGAHPGPTRGHHLGVLRRLHTYPGGHDARPPGRHCQDPDPGRTDPTERCFGSRR